MNQLSDQIPSHELTLIKPKDIEWLDGIFKQFDGYPSLEQVWDLMDKCWDSLNCDPLIMDDRISAFYAHPVWLLNGLFIEQHLQSQIYREDFTRWIVAQGPQRIAELGGGFGTLARMVGSKLPKSTIEIIEPHPTLIAIARAEKTPNVRFRPEINGVYDVLVATDVFEHVEDPLQLLFNTAQHLHINGRYLIANCFYPVISCHLPQTFHFRYSWDTALAAMGLEPSEHVAYGRVFVRRGALNLEAARLIESQSNKIWKITQHLPARLARMLTKIYL